VAELSFSLIEDKLKSIFADGYRKLVFWYDDEGSYADEVDGFDLGGAKLHKLSEDNQLFTKNLLERRDRTSSYLVYAPFSKPATADNHLEDTLLYSVHFHADRESDTMAYLGIDAGFKPIIKKHIKIFDAKERLNRIYDLKADFSSETNIYVALLSAICRTQNASFDEVLRTVLVGTDLIQNKYISEFERYDLASAFWKLCEEHFGYHNKDETPTPQKLAMSLIVTYTDRQMKPEIPSEWKQFLTSKPGNAAAFLSGLMNNVLYRAKYDELADQVAEALHAEAILAPYPADMLTDCDAFAVFDKRILALLTEKIETEDVGVKFDGFSLTELCEKRRKMHFGERYATTYEMLSAAVGIVGAAHYTPTSNFDEMIHGYISNDYKIDTYYRIFYISYDRIEDTAPYENLRGLVEKIYTNAYLAKQIPAWNGAFRTNGAKTSLQKDFFDKYIEYNKDKVAVIISDALRYEVGAALHEKLSSDAKCTSKLDCAIGILPSITSVGIAALLPHKSISLTQDCKVRVDDKPCGTIKERQSILASYRENGKSIAFEDAKNMNKEALREMFHGADVIYIYHNRIDGRGEQRINENQVLDACAETVDEIYGLIRKFSGHTIVRHFIITADHGFLYKRDRLEESDKIDIDTLKDVHGGRRYIVSDSAIRAVGVRSVTVGESIGNDDGRFVSFPVGADVFKKKSDGMNYVHGGSSPQELILPVLDVKTEKGRTETVPAKISLVSTVQKITNLIVGFDFIQADPISDIVKPSEYRLYFVSDDGEKISDEQTHKADSKESNPKKRAFRLRFNLKNMTFDTNKKYYLVAADTTSGLELFRHPMVIDIAFSGDFGFNV
jgi:uncharacterized protein (TIGR02687 family)